jgi:uncharacterized membrane protein YgaE (UPF0421/DUF939 family)
MTRTVVGLLVGLLIGGTSVATAGDQKQQLRHRVAKVEKRMSVLEDYAMYVEAQAVFSIYELDERVTALEQQP